MADIYMKKKFLQKNYPFGKYKSNAQWDIVTHLHKNDQTGLHIETLPQKLQN